MANGLDWKSSLAEGAAGLRRLTLGEILQRLTEHARGEMGEFVSVEDGGSFRMDLAAAERAGKLRLVKKIGYDPRGRPCVELYDAQAALVAPSDGPCCRIGRRSPAPMAVRSRSASVTRRPSPN